MVTRSAIEKRLSELEAKTRPKTIETLADFVLWMANKRPGDVMPEMNPVLAEGLDNFSRKSREAELKRTCQQL